MAAVFANSIRDLVFIDIEIEQDNTVDPLQKRGTPVEDKAGQGLTLLLLVLLELEILLWHMDELVAVELIGLGDGALFDAIDEHGDLGSSFLRAPGKGESLMELRDSPVR